MKTLVLINLITPFKDNSNCEINDFDALENLWNHLKNSQNITVDVPKTNIIDFSCWIC